MEEVKYMVYRLISQTLSIKGFESWLYQNKYVQDHLPDDELIFELVSINLKSKDVFHELEKFCFKNFNTDECLIEVIKANCEMVIENLDENEKLDDQVICAFITNIGRFYDSEYDYGLITQIYCIDDDWELASVGYYSTNSITKDVIRLAKELYESLASKDPESKLKLLRDGLDVGFYKVVLPEVKEKNVFSKWLKFWR